MLGDAQKCIDAFPVVDAEVNVPPFLAQAGGGFSTSSIINSAIGAFIAQVPEIIRPRPPVVGGSRGGSGGTPGRPIPPVLPPGQQDTISRPQIPELPFQDQRAMTSFGAQACACDPKAMRCLPDFIIRNPGEQVSPDPCYPRPSQRTMMVEGCKSTVLTWAKARKKPRMNPLNIRASNRATRRLSGMARALKGARKAVNKAARELK